MKKLSKALVIVIVTLATFSMFAPQNKVAATSGTATNSGTDTSQKSVKLTSWQFIDGKWYYFGVDGVKQTGWLLWNNIWYFLNDDGSMAIGWKHVNNIWYYLDSSGAMQTGWLYWNKSWYYLQSSGAMKTGWVTWNDLRYYLDEKGIMATGWKYINNEWYFLNPGGSVYTGWLKYGGQTYFLKANGTMATGWLQLGKWYYFNEDGGRATGWKAVDNKWYYLNTVNGGMQTGWLFWNNDWYFLQPSGAMQSSGKLSDSTTTYQFLQDGIARPVAGFIYNVAKSRTAKKTNQIITVVASGRSARISFMQKSANGIWAEVFSTPTGFVGKNGVGVAYEGGRLTPKGTYLMDYAFGLGANPGTALPYRQITPNSWWVGEHTSLYNTWQESQKGFKNSERLIDYKQQYKYGIVLHYNMDPVVIGKGSAYFLHVNGNSGYTLGCISMPESNMLQTLQLLKPGGYIINMTSQQEILSY